MKKTRSRKSRDTVPLNASQRYVNMLPIPKTISNLTIRVMLENLKNLVVRSNYVSSIHALIVFVSLIPLYEDQRHFSIFFQSSI
jgi:hypothetical protein